MAANVVNSAIVEAVIAKAEQVKKDNKSSCVTSAHFIMAILEIKYMKEAPTCDDKEFTDVFKEFILTEGQLNTYYTKLTEYLEKTKVFSFTEATTFNAALDFATSAAMRNKKTQIMLSDVVQQVFLNTNSAAYKLKIEATQGKKSGAQASDNVKSGIVTPDLKIELDDLFDDEATGNDTLPFDSLFDEFEPEGIKETIGEIKEIQNKLFQKVFGQDEAISSLISGYFNAIIKSGGERKDKRALATFLFAGAPGVGKTYLAECTAEALGRPFKRFDMSSFHEKEAGLAFAGSNKVYKNGHPGVVTDFVKHNPSCVLLFDEIEKAHINVIHMFLQILDAGILQDQFTEENVSFANSIIIMTTNAGRSLYENEDQHQGAISRKVVLNALANEKNQYTDAPIFPTAICSRFASGNIVLFNPLGALDLIHIVERRMDEYCETFEKQQNIKIERDKYIGAALMFSEGGKADARSLKGRADSFISSEAYNWMKFAYEKDKDKIDSLKTVNVKVDIDGTDEESATLFRKREKSNVLLFSQRQGVFDDVIGLNGCEFTLTDNEEVAKDIIAENNIDFVICDIIVDRADKTLNVEDIHSSGRKLFETFVRDGIPFFVLCDHPQLMNSEERQAMLEQGAHGIFDSHKTDVQQELDEIARLVYCEEMLGRLRRANKVLTFDCNYEWSENGEVGTISVANLRISPAIDAEDRDAVAPIDVSTVTFDQIIGAEDAQAELKSFISYLKDPRQYAKFGVPAPKGVILFGPPGTGKTMLAKALAHESSASFIATQGNAFLKSGLGKGAESMHETFRKARKYAPCVLFIDEFDAIAKDRMSGNDMASDVVNALLNEMDGFSTNPSKPVFVLAATNFDAQYGQKSALDAAVLRRFDRRIFVDLPDRDDRRKYITARLLKSRQKLDEAVIENLSMRSIGMSLAELASVIDFALRTMIMKGETGLSEAMLDEAFETYRFGEKTEWKEETLKRVALHEAGHAFINWHYGKKLGYITVTGRGNFGGYVQTEENESPILTVDDLERTICGYLAGRACETVFYGKRGGASTGAADDLNKATRLAVKMVNELGMVSQHGLAVEHEKEIGNDTVEMCNKILDEQMSVAVDLIKKNKARVQKLADELIRKNHLMGNAVDEIFKN
ncbi:MAG: AAA family ATPase [Clostridia bacterium]|nr:AAA family ATPase [Clostridia bacterium]